MITSADAGGEADVCDVDPGFPVTATVTVTLTGSLRRMVEIWRGDPWADVMRSGGIDIEGPRCCAGPCRGGSPCRCSRR